MDRGSVVAKNAELKKVGEGYTFTEGPAVHRNGDIYFTDQPNDKIFKWSATRDEVTLFKEGGKRSNGMYFDRKDILISCADEENQLIAIDDKGEMKVLIENYKGKDLSDTQIIEAMLQNPILIERPIIVNGNKAIIARPKEKINEIL